MFHSVLMTNLTPFRDTNENLAWDKQSRITIWPEIGQEKSRGSCQLQYIDTNIKKTIKKKKRNRTMFTTDQVRVLEKVFARSKYIDVEKRKEIAASLLIDQKCIKIWFQNRRMKEKKELSESSETTSEGFAESLSPPPEISVSTNNISPTGYTHTNPHSHVIPSQYYYQAPNNYFKTHIHQNEVNNYDMPNNAPTYVNYNYHVANEFIRNENEYSTQSYPQTDFQYFYNAEQRNQNMRPEIQDWPVNIFDTSYF